MARVSTAALSERGYSRHCERSEAIQGPHHAALDCFVARAPRNDG
jgi:hypothetical protein